MRITDVILLCDQSARLGPPFDRRNPHSNNAIHACITFPETTTTMSAHLSMAFLSRQKLRNRLRALTHRDTRDIIKMLRGMDVIDSLAHVNSAAKLLSEVLAIWS